MPFTSIVVNTTLQLDAKKQLATAVTNIFVESMKVRSWLLLGCMMVPVSTQGRTGRTLAVLALSWPGACLLNTCQHASWDMESIHVINDILWSLKCCTQQTRGHKVPVAVVRCHLQTFEKHNHVRILDNEFISFAGDHESPAVMVSISTRSATAASVVTRSIAIDL
jgi:hypothetical protein